MSLQLNTTLPNLFISQSHLQFMPTEVGDERFLLIKIGQDGINAPIRVISDSVAFFQVAVQATPLRFGAETTFTPAPGGTFVHVRYAPKQAGRHEGELLIETGQATQSVTLSGHTTGLLSRTIGSPRPGLAVGLALVLLGGGALAYWGVTHPDTVRSLVHNITHKATTTAPAQPAITRPDPLPDDAPVRIASKSRTTKTKRANDIRAERVQAPIQPDQPEPASVREVRTQPIVDVPMAAPATEPARPAATVPSTPRPVATAPVATRPTADRAAEPKKRPAPSKVRPAQTPSAESDLEKELNGNQ